MVAVHLYVEGGGDNKALRSECRKGFRMLLEKAGVAYRALENATKNTKTKGIYGKGSHSFKLLALLDPSLIRRASPWADRFFQALGAAALSSAK